MKVSEVIKSMVWIEVFRGRKKLPTGKIMRKDINHKGQILNY